MQLSINEWRNAIFESELSQSVKLVALAIARYWKPDKLCYPSIVTLMDDCSIKSKHTIINAIKELSDAKFIKIKKGQIKYLSALQNFYELVGVDDGADDSADDGAVNGASNGATNGAINAPEIREEDNNKKIPNKLGIKKPSQKIKKMVPDDWQPEDKTKAKLQAMGLDVPKVVEKFINSCKAKGLKYLDFDRAVLSWDWSREAACKKKDNDWDDYWKKLEEKYEQTD